MEMLENAMIFAYARISLDEKGKGKKKQKTDRQHYTIEQYAKANKFVVNEFIEEKIHGTVKASSRPQYSKLKEKMRTGDVLILTDVDRLGRDEDDINREMQELMDKGIRLVILDVPFLCEWEQVKNDDYIQLVVKIIIWCKAFMAQKEREKIVDRVKAGMATAKANGKKVGRPKQDVPRKFRLAYEKFMSGAYGEMSIKEFYTSQGICESSYYNYKKAIETESKEAKS